MQETERDEGRRWWGKTQQPLEKTLGHNAELEEGSTRGFANLERLQHFTQHQPTATGDPGEHKFKRPRSSPLSSPFVSHPDPQAALAMPYRPRSAAIPRSVGSGPRVSLITYQSQIDLLGVQNVELFSR